MLSSSFVAPDDFNPAPSEYQYNPAMEELSMSIAQSANAIAVNDALQYYQQTLLNPLEQLALVTGTLVARNLSPQIIVVRDAGISDSQHDSNVA